MIALVLHYLLTHKLEAAGWATTFLGIWLTTQRKLWCWPITLAADILYLIVCYRARLLSDALLQMIFVAFTLYGWWNWWRGIQEEGEVRITPLAPRKALFAIVAGAAGTLILGVIAQRLNAALPFLDAGLTSFSLVASWWQARKHIANWWLWIVVDTLYVPEYIYKDLWLTAVLYAALVGLAILGLLDWRKAPREVCTDQVPA
jgi:nicotinamide mononucleotide transporter